MKPELITLKLSQIIFDEEIYPRTKHDPALVQQYTDTLDEIEALSRFIALSADNKLLDGKHRWLAYRKRYEGQEAPDIRAYRYQVSGWLEEYKLAHELNATHGHQTSMADKEAGAKRFYHYGITSYDDIAGWLHVAKGTVSGWLARTVKESRDKRNKQVQDMWLACATLEEIAKACSCNHQTVKNITDDFSKSVFENRNRKAAATHATDFDPPLYNVWKQQDKTSGVKHFGNSEVRWLNPPYGKSIGQWIAKAAQSAQEGATVVCLVPERTVDALAEALMVEAAGGRLTQDRTRRKAKGGRFFSVVKSRCSLEEKRQLFPYQPALALQRARRRHATTQT